METRTSFWDGSSKTMFFMGLFLGLAVSASLVLLVLLSMISRGQSFTSGSNKPVATVPTTPPVNLPNEEEEPASKLTVSVDEKTDHILGSKTAKITLVEYSDFQCPFCSRFLPTLKQAMKDFPKDVRLVYRHYPLNFHPHAQKAAEASECAAKLGGNNAFWTMHDRLFEKAAAESLGETTYLALAKELRLNEAAFTKCLQSGEMAARVQADDASGNNSGVRGTPSMFLNGEKVRPTGAIAYEQLKGLLVAAGAKQ